MANLTTDMPSDHTGEANQFEFLMKRFLQKHAFLTLARVESVNGNTDPVTVNIRPLILGYSGAGEKIDSGLIYNVPIFRLQGGSSGIYLDPTEDDIGLVAICDADISSVKATKKEAMPASARKHSPSDAIYLGGVLNTAPTQYIKFGSGGISMVSSIGVNINGMKVLPDGRLQLIDGSIVDGHDHGGIEPGSSRTNPLSP